MSPLFAFVAAVVVFLVVRERMPGRAAGVAAAVGAFLVIPVPTVVVLAALGLWVGWRELARRRSRARHAPDDLSLLVDLTGLGLTAGLTFPAAVTAGAEYVDESLSAEVRRVLRDRTIGQGAVGTDGGVTSGLFGVVDRALVTGAPMLPAVSGYATALRSEERHRRLAAVRRLPVKLLFPLSLLILPGFLLLTVGPALLGGLQRLGL
jgi:hypothetical protein